MQFVLPGVEIEFWGHGVHEDEPGTDLNVFKGHGAHGPPSGPVKPVIHKQTALPATEVVFLGHAVQATFPANVLNVLTGHMVQRQPSPIVPYPGLHPHLFAPAWLCEFSRHGRQTPVALVLLKSPEYSEVEASWKSLSDK